MLGVSHIAVGVSDMDRTLPFYRDVLGMSLALDTEEPPSATWGSGPRRAVYLRWSDHPRAAMVVLDQRLEPPFAEDGPLPMFAIGCHHFGFWVDSVDAVLARAEAAGADVWFGPRAADTRGYGEPPGGVIRVAMLRDPDGNVVQVDQRIAAPAPS